MKAAKWPVATAALGVATLAVLLGFSWLPDVRAAYPDGDFGPALSAFQRAETMSDLFAVFGHPADPAKLAAMTAGNTLDLYSFIVVYTWFLVAAAAMLAGRITKPIVLLAIVPALIGAGADVYETWLQLQITGDWSRAEVFLPGVAPACWTKYFALAFHALGCTAICFFGEKKRWILGAGGFLPLAGVFADWSGAVNFPSMMTAVFGVFWLALLGVALAEAVRKPASIPPAPAQ